MTRRAVKANWQFLKVYRQSLDNLRDSASQFYEALDELQDDAAKLDIYLNDVPGLIDRAVSESSIIACMSDEADEIVGSRPYAVCEKKLDALRSFLEQKDEMLKRNLPPLKEGYLDEGFFVRIRDFPETWENIHTINQMTGQYKRALPFVQQKYGALKASFEEHSRELPVAYAEYNARVENYYVAIDRAHTKDEIRKVTIETFPGLASFAPK